MHIQVDSEVTNARVLVDLRMRGLEGGRGGGRNGVREAGTGESEVREGGARGAESRKGEGRGRLSGVAGGGDEEEGRKKNRDGVERAK